MGINDALARLTGVVRRSGLPPKGDVTDWLDAGGTAEELQKLVEATEPWVSPSEGGTR